jgi:hypothetical protein
MRPNGVESQPSTIGGCVTKSGSGRGAADAAAETATAMLAISERARVNDEEFRRMTISPGSWRREWITASQARSVMIEALFCKCKFSPRKRP